MLMTAALFNVSLRIRHPNMDPAKITEILKLTPEFMHKFGDMRKTPTGQHLTGNYKISYWCYSYKLELNMSLNQFLLKFYTDFIPICDFFKKISDEEGTIELYCGFNGKYNCGDTLEWRTLRKLSDLYVELGLEIFPKM